MAWHVAVLSVLMFIPGLLRFGAHFWALPDDNDLFVMGLGAGYAVAAGLSLLWRRIFDRRSLLAALFLTAVTLCGAYFGLLLRAEAQYSRPLLIAASAFVPAGLIAPVLGRRWMIASVVVVLPGLLLVGRGSRWEGGRFSRSEILTTQGHTLRLTAYSGYLPTDESSDMRGGAIAADPVGGGYLVVRPRGELYGIRFDDAGVHVEGLGLQVPINGRDFDADMAGHPEVETRSFRVADLLVVETDSDLQIYASHHFWKVTEKCFVVRVSKLAVPIASWRELHDANWTTIFESVPCLPLVQDRGPPFVGEQIGGNLERAADGRLLLTVGDHQFDGWYRQPNLVQDTTADYGKILLIEPDSGVSQVLSVGHRNPQGLVIDQQGRIWSTEHGPRGGDELNLILEGRNYGYPFVTYGTAYGNVVWPPSELAEDPSQYEPPFHAWVPSIGISDLVRVDGAAWPRWAGDLLVASLRGMSLWRIRVADERVAYVEPIRVGERVRDIAARPGEFVLWTDEGSIMRLQSADALDDGGAIYAVRCSGCHDDRMNGIGPMLGGVVGRQIAGVPNFDYSSALAGIDGDWTEDRLDAFLADPQAFAPGTTMVEQAVPDPEVRSLILDYLQSDVYNYYFR